MDDITLKLEERSARIMAHGAPVYAPKQGTDEGEALQRATKSGATSAACGDRWMELRAQLKERGLTPILIDGH
mgnify:CR=1 FL=1